VTDILVLLLFIFLRLCIFVLLLRFLAQLTRADPGNPISRFVIAVTNPSLQLLRQLLPPRQGFDFASLILAYLLTILLLWLGERIVPEAEVAMIGLGALFLGSVILLVEAMLDLYFYMLIILVVVSWVAPSSRHPGIELIHQVTAPLLNRIRLLIPPLYGLDFSIVVVLLAIYLVESVILHAAFVALMPPGLMQGMR